MELFNLLAKLTLDTKEFDKGLNEAQRAVDSFEMPEEAELELDNDDFNSNIEESNGLGKTFGKDMEDVFNGIKTALTVTGIVGLIAGIVNGLKEAVNMTAQTADGIDKGADRLNISKKKYQEWDHALRQSGSSISDLSRGVRNLGNYVDSFRPGAVVKDAKEAVEGAGGDIAQVFAELGIEVKKSNGQLKSSEELIEESLLALSNVKDIDHRGVLTRMLFGNNSDGLNNLLNQGEEGVKALLSEASDLGLIMSDEEISNAVAYGDAVANLNEEINAIKQAFVADIIPVLTEAVQWLTDFLAKLNPRLQTSSIFDVFNQIDAKALIASRKVDEANATAKKLIEDLQNMGDYWSLDEQGRMTWDALAEKALELFPQLSEYIDKDGKKIQGNTKDIEKNIDAWSRLEKQRLLSAAMDEKREAVAKQLVEAYSKGADAATKEDEAFGKQATAIEQVNAVLKKNEELRNAIYGAFGTTTITNDNAEGILSFIREKGFQTVGMDALDEWAALKAQAQGLRTEADDMISKAEEANNNLDDYEKKLSEQMGLATDDIKKETVAVYELKDALDSLSTTGFYNFGTGSFISPKPRAIGDAYIPYDNFPALLHRGEKVLTATQVRRGEGSGGIDYGHLEDRIAAAIRAGMADATVNAIVTDRQVAKGANRYNGNEIDSGRFRP